MTPDKITDYLKTGHQQKAFRALYKLLPAIKKWIKKEGGQIQYAEDILQEAIIVFYRKCQDSQFVLTVKPETYVFSIAKNIIRAENRKVLKIEKLETGFADEIYNDDDYSLENESRFESIESSMNAIGEKCMEILKRFYYTRQSMSQIAAEMGFRNEKVAKAVKHRCLEKTRNILNIQSNERN